MNARDLLLMITYHFAATVILYLMAHHAGHVWGLDGLVDQLAVVERHPSLRPLFG